MPDNSRRTVLVTGCSSGIGYTAAKELMARGYDVIASARRPEDVDTLRKEGIPSITLDLADSGSIRAAAEEVSRRSGGRLFGLVNNGAFALPGAVEDLDRDAMRRQFETNVFGTMELTNALLPLLEKSGGARIIMISSILGLVAMPWRGAYNASKFALEGFTQTLRLELADRGVKVIIINPGPIESRFRLNAQQHADDHLALESSRHREVYEKMRASREREDGKMPLSLPPEAVVRRIVTALESSRPAMRYLVTRPAHWLALAKRLLPESWLDAILRRASR
ncbi:MAG: SDR family NAD(P)-dependent oxidoreductase [Gammaproteobacteria bacterium]|nr:SDR family NAD(P)-dependent oxidoreductase [Gammaproteobacteria bacterium]